MAQVVEHLEHPTEAALKLEKAQSNAELLYYHTDHLGTPRELTDRDGHIVWAASYKAWGNTLTVEYPELEAKAEPLVYPLQQGTIEHLGIQDIQ